MPSSHMPLAGLDVSRANERILAQSDAKPAGGAALRTIVFVIDDDSAASEALNVALEEGGMTVRPYATCEDFLAAYRPGREACLLVDANVPGIGGLELLRRLTELGHRLPVVMMIGALDVSIVVKAMKAGVLEFIEKPIAAADLLDSVHRVIEQSQDSSKLLACHSAAARRIATLTPRQHQVLAMILDGAPNKNIAADLHISQRTVEVHRAAIMQKTGTHSLPELARLAIAAAS